MEKYSEYKDSGIEWLGEIPSHWSVVATKWIARLYTGNSLNEKQKEKYSESRFDTIPYLSSKDINLQTDYVDYENGLYIPITEKKFRIAKKDSFLLCIEGGSAGRKHAFLKKDVCFVNKLCCFESIINSKFHYYFIQNFYFRSMFTRSIQGLIGGVSPSTIKTFYTLIPSLSEQDTIAKHLDYQTSKIDAVIAQQQKMIDLLNERKQIIINKAVTKGLNPNVPMKDSGIDWIGKIPEHWNTIRIKYLLKEQKQRSANGQEEPLSMSQMYGLIPTKEMPIIPNMATSYVGAKLVNRGDLVFNKLKAHLGVFNVSNFEGLVSPDYAVYSSTGLANLKFLEYVFKTPNCIREFIKLITGVGAGLSRLYTNDLYSIYCPLPPLDEQNEICNYIESQTSEITKRIKDYQKFISLLQERKQIIINEVVTGKVKVS